MVITAALDVRCEARARPRSARALVVEDGPPVTHGAMPHGAGWIAARREGAREIIDPRPFAVGSIRAAYEGGYPHIGPVLPALGYSEAQRDDLRATIAACAADVIVNASPSRLDRALSSPASSIARVSYAFVRAEARASRRG